MTIEKVETQKQLQRIEKLAFEIWHEHYTPIIGRPQVEYMLEVFQSTAAMTKQLEEGYLYYLLTQESDAVGYMAVQPEKGQLFMSKFYIKSSHRGKGYGRAAIDFLKELADDNALNAIVLTVNKNNTDTLKVYERLGFINAGALVQPIGNGYVMDDYKMIKRL